MSVVDERGANPFAPPVAKVEDAAPVVGDLAGRGIRLVASIVDGLLVGLGFLILYAVSSINLWAPQRSSPTAFWTGYGLVMLGFFVIQAWLLHTRSQTLGKMVTNIRIVRQDGSRAGVVRLVGLRLLPMYLIGLVPFVGALLSLVDSLLIFRDSRRCLHDVIADTIVVSA